MLSKLVQAIFILLVLLGIYSCGSGATDSAGIGGTGGIVNGTDDDGIGGTGGLANVTDISSSGTITGFGSIFVNGIEFETDLSDIEVNENKGDEANLKLGMVVKVKGVVNEDGITGTALEIEYEHDIVGPITSDPTVDPDNTMKSFEVLGVTVLVDKTGTVFHDCCAANFDFDTISQNDYVDISGFFDQNNRLHATSIELLPISFDNSGNVVITGNVTNLNGTDSFLLGPLTIRIEATTDLSRFDGAPIQNDMWVKVKGTMIAPYTISARKIKPVDDEDDLVDDNDDNDDNDTHDETEYKWKSVEGLITELNKADHSFKVDGHLSDYTKISQELTAYPLENNMRVEIAGFEGSDDIIEVEEIRGRGGNIEIHCIVADIKEENSIITVQFIAGQSIDIQTDIRSQMEDKLNDEDDMSFGDLDIGDFLKIKAMIGLNGTLTANRILRDELDNDTDYYIRGPVTLINKANKEIDILGITISTSDDTDFEMDDYDFHSPDEFFAVVKIDYIVSFWDRRGEGVLFGDGIAEEIEIEN